jgi:NAD(P)-dependent dehydrogenase (short-subunit alcohol dehydrogenase family)
VDYHLEGRRVLVTGAAGSIGKGIAEGFAREGAALFITDQREEPLGRVREGVLGSGGRCELLAADVTNAGAVKAVFTGALSFFGGAIDVLVNVAGIVGQSRIEDTSEEEWDRIFAVNCKGTFLFIREAVPLMKIRKSGKIVNFSSKSGKTGSPLMGAYSAAKAAIIGLTQSLAHELADFGVTVNCLCPGLVEETGVWDALASLYTGNLKKSRKEIVELFSSKVPLKRLATIDDIAALVLFIASKGGDYLTGQAFNVSGGREMH